jgi:disease resistance protein RPM1
MPRLQHFKFDICPEDFSGTEFNVNDLALIHLPSLQTVQVRSDGEQTVGEELAMKVKEVLKNEARSHPNHPDTDIRMDGHWIQLCMYVLLFLPLLL